MKLTYTLIALAVLMLPVVGSATAGNGEDKKDQSLLWIDLRPVNGQLIYLDWEGHLWQEENSARGLQTTKTVYSSQNIKEPDVRFSGP